MRFHRAITALLCAALAVCCACGGGRRGATTGDETRRADGKITVDGYLFDVKALHDGHPRSVRLQVFYGDTVALITARGYLGKGVGRGVWRPDSTVFLFPTEGEYYVGPLDSVTGADCVDGGLLQEALPALLSGDPARILNVAGLRLVEREDNRLRAELDLGSCAAPLEIEFDRRGDGQFYYIREFGYTNADGRRIVDARRREIRLASDLELEKLEIAIPTDATPISW
ncbi:MAG TPA: hypothetical protein VLB27_02440 [candidate division Zixibacteria bacterium]|nr:hypothetical protein [candidate division Zixibacteria bacterium]